MDLIFTHMHPELAFQRQLADTLWSPCTALGSPAATEYELEMQTNLILYQPAIGQHQLLLNASKTWIFFREHLKQPRLVLGIPASSATAEWSFSATTGLKSWHKCAMGQALLNRVAFFICPQGHQHWLCSSKRNFCRGWRLSVLSSSCKRLNSEMGHEVT